MRRRTALVAVALPCFCVCISGCITVGVGSGDIPALNQYVLQDVRPAAAAAIAATAGASGILAIQSVGADPLADTSSIVYSRAPGERGVYQLAAWTDRPSRRLAQLAQQRLEASGRFAAVVRLGQPVSIDWLLTLAIETMAHDVAVAPGRARLVVRAELFDRHERRLLAYRRFSAEPSVANATSADAVAAFSTALTEVLDQLTPWVTATVPAASVK